MSSTRGPADGLGSGVVSAGEVASGIGWPGAPLDVVRTWLPIEAAAGFAMSMGTLFVGLETDLTALPGLVV